MSILRALSIAVRRPFKGIGLLAVLLVVMFVCLQLPMRAVAQTPPPQRCDWSDQNYTDFYTPLDLGVFTPDRLGEVLRVEHIRSYTPGEVAAAAGLPSSPYGAEAYRILYLSQAPAGTPRAVSGLIVVPIGRVPAGGFPVISDGHGTTGLADTCAPSRQTYSVQDLLLWVAYGYLVSATDYVGLGTPGLHPYVVGEAEAFSMLDGARAGRRFCDTARGIDAPVAANRIFIEGHSQGGHAALSTHQAWQNYAPELNVLGTVAFAPGSEPRFLAQRMAEGSSMLVGPGSLGMYAYSVYYGAPDNLQTWLKEPYASELPGRVERQCAVALSFWLGFNPDRVYQPDLLAAVRQGRWEDMQPWTVYMDTNTPGNYSSDVPVLVLQGQADPLIPPEASERLTYRLCIHGTPTLLSRYAGVGHGVPKVGRPDALQWMADRLAGRPMTDSCTEVLDRGTWMRSRSMPTARSAFGATLMDQRIYVAGGLDAGGQPLTTFELYDLTTKTWQTAAQLPTALHHLGMTSAGGRVYVMGGYDNASTPNVSATWAYDPTTNTWVRQRDMPAPRAAHVVTAIGSELYVVGGVGPNAAALWVYNPATDTWDTSRAPLPTAREQVSAAVVDGKLYVIGGRWTGFGNLSTVEVYDPATNTWARRRDMPTPRGGLTAAAFDGRIHVTGGEATSTQGPFGQHEVYDMATDTWSTQADLPTPRHGLASVVAAGRWYVIGGGTEAGSSASDMVEIFVSICPDFAGPLTVGVEDIQAVANLWQHKQSLDPDWDDVQRFDLDRDGDIDIVDITRVTAVWGTTCS